jgi:hypothetical protein
MKILLDESLPRKLKGDFGLEHEVWTVRDKGWLGQKNGALLKLIVEEEFEIFITVDRNLPFQQKLEKFPLIIVILVANDNRLQTLRKLIPKLLAKLSVRDLNKVIEIS